MGELVYSINIIHFKGTYHEKLQCLSSYFSPQANQSRLVLKRQALKQSVSDRAENTCAEYRQYDKSNVFFEHKSLKTYYRNPKLKYGPEKEHNVSTSHCC